MYIQVYTCIFTICWIFSKIRTTYDLITYSLFKTFFISLWTNHGVIKLCFVFNAFSLKDIIIQLIDKHKTDIKKIFTYFDYRYTSLWLWLETSSAVKSAFIRASAFHLNVDLFLWNLKSAYHRFKLVWFNFLFATNAMQLSTT